MSDELDRVPLYRKRGAELRRIAAKEPHANIRYQMFQIAAEYGRLATRAEALKGIERCSRRSTSAVILPFAPRA
jgi:hypothetical protein